jgi:hypothetical protein
MPTVLHLDFFQNLLNGHLSDLGSSLIMPQDLLGKKYLSNE